MSEKESARDARGNGSVANLGIEARFGRAADERQKKIAEIKTGKQFSNPHRVLHVVLDPYNGRSLSRYCKTSIRNSHFAYDTEA